MPYLTPPDLPEEDDCRPLFIPASTDWLALFGGALTELTKTYNWEDSGGLSVQDTVEKMNEIINTWYAEACTDCSIPETEDPPFRINGEGHIQELVDGEWVEPEGDYELPPITAREDGTEADQICLASKNAVNVLHQLYESLSDSFGMDLSADEALLALIELLVTLIGVVFAPIAFVLAQLVIAVFTALFAALEWITEDLWDENFTEALTCILQSCASNDAGVVTFDYACVQEKLSTGLDGFDISADQARLYVQLTYLLSVIGGVDALNLAGATTAITDDDCSFCEDTWCYEWDQAAFESEWTFDFGSSNGHWFVDAHILADDYPTAFQLTQGELDVTADDVGDQHIQFWTYNYSAQLQDFDLAAGANEFVTSVVFPTMPGIAISGAPTTGSSGAITVTRVLLRGTGTNPFGTSNCD